MKSKINKIIIVTDFSTFSESAFKTGIAIAERQKAEVSILHVMDRLDYLDLSKPHLPNNGFETYHYKTAGKYLDKLAAKINMNTGIIISSRVLEGPPAETICAYAYQYKANLIVMGTRGISGARELFMGSDAFKIIKGSSCPVLTVPSEWNKTSFGRVLFPVELKPGTFEKYFYAQPIIEKNNSEICILGLSERNKPGKLKELTRLVDKLKIQLHHDQVSFQSAFCPCTDFPERVVQSAEEFSASLAVIAVNSDDYLNSIFVRPFAQQLLNELKIPILSIKPHTHSINSNLQYELAENCIRNVN